MAISLSCPSCERKTKVKDELAGRKVKCPQCGAVIRVPEPEMVEAEEVPARPRPPSLEEIEERPRRKSRSTEEVDRLRALVERFPEMIPVKRPPNMWTVNGIGTMAYGSRDFDEESGTYVKTLCFTLVFVPIVAISAYRVATANPGWYFLGKVPLSGFAKSWNCFMLVLALVCAVLLYFVF